ncbi:hypothetical protein DL96DRAFT_1761090 [Flagelloscypha sp. PMI_526]|nr:hypothetical protein DL96DRAFT_1761090 [Flagelloscypha sp. PMI_526]
MSDDLFSSLPSELAIRILSLLSATMILTCRRVSKHMYTLTKDSQLWPLWPLEEAYHPKPVLFAATAQELEHIISRTQHLRALALSHKLTSSPPPFQRPTRTLFEDFTDLLDVTLLPGGQIMVTVHRRHFCAWWIPLGLISSKEDKGDKNGIRLIGMTTKLDDVYIAMSCFETSDEGKQVLQLNFMTIGALTVFKLPLSMDSDTSGLIAPISTVPLPYKTSQATSISNGRYLIYQVDPVSSPNEVHNNAFMVILVFDCVRLRFRQFRLSGIRAIGSTNFDFSIEGIIEQRTLVAKLVPEKPTKAVQVWLYQLPALNALGSPPAGEDPTTTIQPSDRFELKLSNGQWVSWVKLFGDRFVGIAIYDHTILQNRPGHVILHLLEICNDFTEDSGLRCFNKILVSRGEVLFPSHYARAELANSWGCVRRESQALFVDIPGQRHLRMIWSNQQNQPVLLTVDLDIILGENENQRPCGMVHKIRLDDTFGSSSVRVAVDAISGRCVYVLWTKNPVTGMDTRAARIFEGLGTICDNTCQDIHRG